MALALARQGARLLLTSKNPPEKTLAMIEEFGGEAVSRAVDVSEESDVVNLFFGVRTEGRRHRHLD